MLNLALALFFLLTSGATNDQIVSKSFTGSFTFILTGEPFCVTVTTENACTEADVNAITDDASDMYTLGDCSDDFEKSCNIKVEKYGMLKGEWPHTVSAEESNACGETVFTVLTKECSACAKIGALVELNENVEVTEHTCEDHEPGFLKAFINKILEGELLYIGILLALITVPFIICILICCCCMAAQPQPVTTYKIRSAV